MSEEEVEKLLSNAQSKATIVYFCEHPEMLQKLFSQIRMGCDMSMSLLAESLRHLGFDFNKNLGSGYSLIHFFARDGLLFPLQEVSKSNASLGLKVLDHNNAFVDLDPLSICLYSAYSQRESLRPEDLARFHAAAHFLTKYCAPVRLAKRDMPFGNNSILSFDAHLPLYLAIALGFDDVASHMILRQDCEHDRECLALAASKGLADTYYRLADKNFYEDPPTLCISN